MKFFLQTVVFLLSFVFLSVFDASAGVVPTKHGVKYIHSGFQCRASAEKLSLKNANCFISPRDCSGISIDEIRFVIAVPVSYVPEPVSVDFITSPLPESSAQAIESMNSTNTDDSFSLSGRSNQLSFEELGLRRGVRLLLAKLLPYTIDDNNRPALISELSFELDFGFDIPNEIIDASIAELFASVENASHLPYLLRLAEDKKVLSASIPSSQFNPNDTAWYDSRNEYARIITKRDGIAFVTGDSLIAAQPAFSGADLSHLRLLYRGKEVPFAAKPDSSTLSSATTIYFKGIHCPSDTAWFDYYTDEAVFFLEYNHDTTRTPLRELPDIGIGGPVSEVFTAIHREKDRIYFHMDKPYETETSPAENWYWIGLDPISNQNIFDTIDFHPVRGQSYNLTLRLGSWYCDNENSPYSHRLGCTVNDILVLDSLLPFKPKHTIEISLPDSVFRDGSNYIKLTSIGLKDDFGQVITTDVLAPDYYEISGITELKTRTGQFQGDIEAQEEPFTAHFSGFTGTKVHFIDSRNRYFATIPVLDSQLVVHLPSSALGYSLLASDQNRLERASVKPVSKTNLRNEVSNAKNIIIYHEKFEDAAKRFRDYHNSTGDRTEIFNIDDIYKEYSYGKKNPWAIRYFLRDARARWQSMPEYLTLIGGACTDARKVIQFTTNNDYIPAYGMPLSDYWYSLLDEESGSNTSSLIIGRIPARNNQEALDFLDKYSYVDSLQSQAWENKVLLISGGSGADQRARFRTVLISGYNSMILKDVCADSITFSRYDDEPYESQGPMIRDSINNGTGMILFVGHGSPQYIDNDGWQVQRLANTGRYPHLLTVSCNTADFAITSGRSRNDEYIMEKNKGCVGTIGFTYLSEINSDYPIANNFFTILGSRDRKSTTYAGLLNELKDRLGIDYKYQVSMILTYLGDPLSKIRYAETDLFFPSNSVKVFNGTNLTDLSEFDSTAFVDFEISNLGFRPLSQFRVMAVRSYESRSDTAYTDPTISCHSASLRFKFPVKDMKGRHYLTIVIDPDSSIYDKDRRNNTLTTFFDVLPKGILMLDPINNLDVYSKRPMFSFIMPNQSDTNKTKMIVTNAVTRDTLFTSSEGGISNSELFSSWSPERSLSPDSLYYLDSYSSFGSIDEKHTLHVPFHAMDAHSQQSALWRSFSTDLLNNSNENLIWDGASSLIIDTIRAPYSITAAAWDSDSNIYRLEVVYRNKTLIEVSHQGARPRGFNIVTLDGHTLDVKKIVRFDTWGDDLEPEKDSSAVRLVAYLRDSVSRDDYILIGTCDESFRLTLVDKNLKRSGSIDTLKTVLAAYGLKDVDSLAFKATLAMLGKWNAAPGQLPQIVVKNYGKVAIINDTLKLPQSYAKISTKLIGPAQSWIEFSVSGDLKDSLLAKRILIKGYDKDKSNPIVLAIDYSSLSIPLSSIQAKAFPYIQAEIELEKYSDSARASISSLNCKYVYSPESAISSEHSGFVADTVMKGDSATVRLSIWNIARRSSFAPLPTNLSLSAGTVTVFQTDFTLDKLDPYSYFNDEVKLPTDDLLGDYHLQVHTDSPRAETELYLFNNYLNLPLYVAKDKEKPNLKFIINGREVADGDFVPQIATARVELRDNSAIPVNPIEAISIRLNGYILSNENTDNWTVNDFGRERPLKYQVSFGKELDVNDNIFEVIGIDAAGNSEMLNLRLWVSRDASFTNVETFPNPTPGNCSFEFDLKTPDAVGNCNIEIFDLMGIKVRTIDASARLGHNKVDFDGLDSNNNLIPQGVYNYRLNLVGRWAEPVIGKFAVVR